MDSSQRSCPNFLLFFQEICPNVANYSNIKDQLRKFNSWEIKHRDVIAGGVMGGVTP